MGNNSDQTVSQITIKVLLPLPADPHCACLPSIMSSHAHAQLFSIDLGVSKHQASLLVLL